ncbi:MAG: phosphohydrolase [Gemmatales bacterium]|nr:MAG: phosphohydrolase [Gemmatales bacterium]
MTVPHPAPLGATPKSLSTPSSLAGFVGSTGQILNLDDAYAIDESRPYRFNKEFDRKNNYRTRSILCVPFKEPAGSVVGVLQLINALDRDGQPTTFDPKIEPLILSLASQAAVAIRNAQLTQDLKEAHYETILRLSNAAEHRDPEMGRHIQRMSQYAGAIASGYGLSETEVEMIVHACPMHDIGKLGIPDAILLKPGKLTKDEYEVMKTHTEIGGKILSNSKVPVLQLSEVIARNHHERWDGSGYPQGKKGEEIPLAGRIAAIADVFDALSSPRCYKKAFSVDESIAEIRKNSGIMFDPKLVKVFDAVLDKILNIKEAYPDNT